MDFSTIFSLNSPTRSTQQPPPSAETPALTTLLHPLPLSTAISVINVILHPCGGYESWVGETDILPAKQGQGRWRREEIGAKPTLEN
ncbi:unnamed protein product [Linum trigynum]|uniref:Uncharacterized protein n=1 Tax=Linum trigynum TaxID=586398 RepID=A0AAV2G0A2_9ROSI